ncbi:hypothetical protein TorRG33x02_199930 [Trema orientale]|uniref:Uncharacterized protein n=1 Tax=Trema orientale TaxID=63057 RepID=A0A2P5EFB6_TREOI|nr:hypothetical protein TorRG33x02_199930 [Trema orientale]
MIAAFLCNRSMRQEPHLYGVKSLYAHKVEVHDYKLLCLARVEVRDQKFSLVGILGGWATEHPTPLREVHGGYWEITNNRHNDHQRNAVCLENLEFENSNSRVITAPPLPPVPVFADNF